MMLANALVLLRTPVLIVVQGYTCNPYAYNPLGITAPTSPGSRRQQRLRTQLSASPHGNGRRVLHGNLLEQLQRHTTIWADTANVASVERLSRVGIVDVTTNPSIVSATALGDEDAASALLAQVTIGECMVGWLWTVRLKVREMLVDTAMIFVVPLATFLGRTNRSDFFTRHADALSVLLQSTWYYERFAQNFVS